MKHKCATYIKEICGAREAVRHIATQSWEDVNSELQDTMCTLPSWIVLIVQGLLLKILRERPELISQLAAVADEGKGRMDINQLTTVAVEVLKGLHLLIVGDCIGKALLHRPVEGFCGDDHCKRIAAGVRLAALLHSLGFVPLAQMAQRSWTCRYMQAISLASSDLNQPAASTCRTCTATLREALQPLCDLFKLFTGASDSVAPPISAAPVATARHSPWSGRLRQITRTRPHNDGSHTSAAETALTAPPPPPPLPSSHLKAAFAQLPAVTARVAAAHALATATTGSSGGGGLSETGSELWHGSSASGGRGALEAARTTTLALNRLDHSRPATGGLPAMAGPDTEAAVTAALLLDPQAL